MNWLYLALAGTLSGALGAMGMGGGGVLIIYLTLIAGVEQSAAQGINLIFFLPAAAIALLFYLKKKLIVWRLALPCAVCGVLGALLGTLLSGWISGDFLRKLFGGLLFVMGISQLFRKNPKKKTDSKEKAGKSRQKGAKGPDPSQKA